MVSIRDPVDNKLIVKVRNPSVPIKSYVNPEKAKIDLNKSITDGENNPPINSEPHLRYTEEFKGWSSMLHLVGDKRL